MHLVFLMKTCSEILCQQKQCHRKVCQRKPRNKTSTGYCIVVFVLVLYKSAFTVWLSETKCPLLYMNVLDGGSHLAVYLPCLSK